MTNHYTVDLHTHSTASDGDLSPVELIEHGKKNGIKVIALTDHDTIDGLRPAEKVAEKIDVVFVPGIEISAKNDEELHILGYHIERDDQFFLDALEVLIKYRNIREEITIDYLKSKGVDITAEEVKDATKGNIIGRPHMAAVMISKGYVKTKKEAFEKYIGTPEFMSLDRPKVTAVEGLEIIKKGHGVPVLAHPHSLKQTFHELDKTVGELKSMGLKGIECYYNNYNKNDIVNYLSLAAKHNLVPVGGSDFHGPVTKPDIKIGSGKDYMLDYNNLDIVDTLYGLKE